MKLATIDFHGASLIALRGDTPAETLVAMKPIVEGMGLAWESQLAKIKAHPVLSQGMTMIVMPSSGGAQEMVGLPLTKLNFWLATIHPNKVSASTRAKVIAYQVECADVLFAHFFAQTTAGEAIGANQMGGIVKAVVRKAIAEAIESQLPGMVAAAISADPRVAAVHLTSAREMLDKAKVPSRGRGPLNRKFSHRLPGYAVRHGVLPARCPHSGTYLYTIALADQFMREVGAALIASHKAKLNGQTVLQFPAGPK